MKKVEEWIRNHKVLSGVIGVLLVIVVLACSCSNEETEDIVEDSSPTQQEITQEDTDKKEPKEEIEEEEDKVVEEPKEEVIEPEEEEKDVDTYVNNNPNPSYNNMEVVDNVVEGVLYDSYPSSSYDVALESDGDKVAIVIISKDLDINGISQSQLNYMLEQYNLPEVYDNLAETVKEVYGQYGFNVSVGIRLYDMNRNTVYTAYAY